MRLLIKGGHVIDIKNNLNNKLDILIENKKIAAIKKSLKVTDTNIFDATGLLVLPGLIDMHAHLREPGYEHKETIACACRSAAAGGFTSVCAMANTNPITDNPSVVEFVLNETQKIGLINIFCIGAITKGAIGEELSEIIDLKNAGVVALSDDGKSVANAEVLRRAMEYASMVDLPIISHCEDEKLSRGGLMNEGYVSGVLGLKGIPRISEIITVARDIEIARYTKTRLHIAHISCKESVELLKKAKKDGVLVTGECTPHHFTLTEEAVVDYNTNTKVNPPLRTKDDIVALKKGLADGTIDCIATDHAPHAEAEKDLEYDNAPFGIIGFETAVALVISELVKNKVISLKQIAEKMSYNPARILKLDKGYINENVCADIVVIDPGKEWVFEKDAILSKSRNSPFIGKKMTGKVVLTICAGKTVYSFEKNK